MNESISAVTFDLDGTLCTYRRSPAEVLCVAFERVGVDALFPAAAYEERFPAYVEESSSLEDLRTACFADLAAAAGRDPEIGREVATAYTDERDQRAVEALPGALEAVETLAGDYRLAIVSNGDPAAQEQKLEGLGLTDRFDATVFGGFDTAAKPDPEPFERALSALETAPEQAVHVGNSLESDVVGAFRAGVASAWLRDEEAPVEPDPAPTYVLDSLEELQPPPWE